MKRELRLIYSTQEQSNNGKRNTSLDMARGIAIILIVIGHSGFVDKVPAVWLSTFHLPAFFLLSGWLIAEKQEMNLEWKPLFLRKISGIIVPYLWFSAGSLILDFIQVLRGSFSGEILLQHLAETVSLQGYSVMWFLPVLFFAQLGVIGCYRLFWKKSGAKGASYTITAFIWTMGAIAAYGLYRILVNTSVHSFVLAELRIIVKAVIAAAFLTHGVLVYHVTSRLREKKSKAILFLIGAGCVVINIVAACFVQHMDLNNLNVGFLPLYLCLGTCGSIGLIFLCLIIPNFPILTFFGQNSLIIMCTHLNFYVMYLAIRITDFLVLPFGNIPILFRTMVMFLLTMLIEIPVILVIRIFLPFVLGRARAHRESQPKAG